MYMDLAHVSKSCHGFILSRVTRTLIRHNKQVHSIYKSTQVYSYAVNSTAKQSSMIVSCFLAHHNTVNML